jgi:hypothetical protein
MVGQAGIMPAVQERENLSQMRAPTAFTDEGQPSLIEAKHQEEATILKGRQAGRQDLW